MNGQKNKRAKACDISRKVRLAVMERDQGVCVLCWQNNGVPNAHFISRAHGGKGIEENIVTLCLSCHDKYDHGIRADREIMRGRIREYLKDHYSDWNEDDLIYRKWEWSHVQ